MKRSGKILIFDNNNKILVLRRSNTHPLWPKYLDFPGGVIEKLETPEIGIIREVEEETGLVIYKDLMRLLTSKKRLINYFVYIFNYQLKDSEPSLKLSWEHDKYYWMTTQELINQPIPKGADWFYKFVVDYIQTKSEK